MSEVVEFRAVEYKASGKTILSGLNLQVAAGETLVLLGRSGSGKTTALRLVNALLLPASGEVMVQGKSTRDWNVIELRRKIGYVIQESGLLPHLTISENISLVPRLMGASKAQQQTRAAELLDQIGLPSKEFASRYPRELSGGQRQRAGVARALAADPSLLLFDEPFGALDPVTRLEMQRLFLQLREQFQKTSIFVTHDIREAIAIGTRIGLLHEGRLEFLGPARDFPQAESAEARAFLECLQPA